jgi:hypothetical protein
VNVSFGISGARLVYFDMSLQKFAQQKSGEVKSGTCQPEDLLVNVVSKKTVQFPSPLLLT